MSCRQEKIPSIRDSRPRKSLSLFALSVDSIFLTEATILAQLQLFFHLLLIALSVMRNPAAARTLELCHVFLDLSHNIPIKTKKYACRKPPYSTR
jgi:hypothetical protein